ncbi:HP0495 family protein [Vreelandella zhaodongensis]|uniref:HP0495 family protein n=1 Tax=Vreelandella zhaodongensis TaxID=1176240 RepID=UPI003EB8DBEA
MKEGTKKGLRDLRQPTASEPPKITFPCDYSLKIVGDAADDFTASVCQVIVKHAPDFDESSLQVVDSRNGRFQSVRVTIVATGEQQIRQLFDDLKATGRVHMVV